jgi:hypothetical protein
MLADDDPSMTLQPRPLMELSLREARRGARGFANLHDGGVSFRATVITGASADRYGTASPTTARLGRGALLDTRTPGTHPPHTDRARKGGGAGRGPPAASGLLPGAVDRTISGEFAFL